MTLINNDLLKSAVLDGDLETVKNLLSSGTNPNYEYDEHGTTLLHLVSSPDIARELIKFNSDIEAKDAFGRTPLCCAVAKSWLFEVVKVLISAGARINVTTKIGNTPLHLASDARITNLLLTHGAKVNVKDKIGRFPIHSALIDGKGLDVLQALLAAGADVNVKMGAFENSLLHYAHSYDFTRGLLLEGAHVDALKIDGQTPLHCAVRHMKDASVVRELLKWGANVDIADYEGETALGLAMRCYIKNFDVIKELVRYGANINIGMYDCSLMRYCFIIESAAFSDISCAKLLVKMFVLKNWDGKSNLQIRLSSQRHINNGNEVLKYSNNCISEIIQMKSDKMIVKCTLYELVSEKGDCVMPIYGSYRAIEKDLENKYPIYHDIIMEQVTKGLERARLLTRLEQIYTNLKCCKDVLQEIKLNSDCLLLIARYLSNSDILNIIITFEDYFFPAKS